MRKRNSSEKARFLSRRPFTVLFSGGKDSLAALLWVLDNVRHDNWDVLYIEVTGNTHQLCNKYVHKIVRDLGLEERFIHAKREDLDFFECVKKWGVPLLGIYRWCMWHFKIKVVQKYSHLTQVTGIKKSDSYHRRNVKPIDVVRATKFITVNPILEWSTGEVIDFIKEHGVRLNPCYDLIGHSGNCVFCPYHNKKQIVLTLQDPEWRARILGALQYAKGRLSRKIARRWMKLAKQSVLVVRA